MFKSKKLSILLIVFVITITIFAQGPKNVIFLIGDGMGLAHVTLTDFVFGDLNMMKMPYTGFASTYSNSNTITDSAAAGTALSTGFKTDNGMIGMTPDKKPAETLLEKGIKLGKKTGMVTTTAITHATPACFTAHVEKRYFQRDIAEQQAKSDFNVLFGGGKKYMEKNYDSAKKHGFEIVNTSKELMNAHSDKVMGIFAKDHMNYSLDRTADEPSLALMTRKAIELLSKDNDKGFFLVVEGGRIDHAAHSNDPIGVIYDTKAFDKAVGEAMSYANLNKDTLVVVTADHETGGLGLGRKGYNIYPAKFKGFKAIPDTIVSKIKNDCSNMEQILEEYTTYKMSDFDKKELAAFKKARLAAKPSAYSQGGYATVKFVDMINDLAGIDWTTGDHSACMVPVMSYGMNAEDFEGFMDNTQIPVKIMNAVTEE